MKPIAFVHPHDRKILTVVSEALAYAKRELADLRASQPALSSAIENAHQLSAALAGTPGEENPITSREVSSN